jgi:hypothetical protein
MKRNPFAWFGNQVHWLLACGLIACSPTAPDPSRPSGIKNMAPAPISETVQDLEVEPNDTFAQATSVQFSGEDMRFSGHLEPGDVDTWLLKAKTGTIVDIEVAPSGFMVFSKWILIRNPLF